MSSSRRSSESPVQHTLRLDPVGSPATALFVPARRKEHSLDPLRSLSHRYGRPDPEVTNDYASLLKNIKERRRQQGSSLVASQSHDLPSSSALRYLKRNNSDLGSRAVPRASSRAGSEVDEDAFSRNGSDAGKRRGRIRVAIRKRPVDNGDEDCIEVDSHVVHINATKLRVDLSQYTESHRYTFDDAFTELQTNEDVYVDCAKPLIEVVMNGGSASCFAYGQTGSGKTHTMLGTEYDKGIYLRAAQDIFERRDPDEHQVFVSLYEIYCNSLFDLLNSRALVIAREDANRRVNICGLTWHEIGSQDELARLMERGAGQRRTGSTSANEYSSRSHAVLCLMVRSRTRPKFTGTLNVVDLAGSERAADTAANDKQTRLEGAEINKSLLALKECIRGLDERKKHIPFRGSKLTEVLRDSFSGNSQTVMVATISSSAANAEHTMNTLRYAFRVKGLSVDKLEPSKDRKAPPPVSKRGEPTPPRSTSILSQPLPALKSPSPTDAAMMLRHRKKSKKTSSKRRLRDEVDLRDPSVRAVEKQLEEVQRTVRSEIDSIREEMRHMMRSKEQEIERLAARNTGLESRLQSIQTQVPPEYQHIFLEPLGPTSPVPAAEVSPRHPLEGRNTGFRPGMTLGPMSSSLGTAHVLSPITSSKEIPEQKSTRSSRRHSLEPVVTNIDRDDNLF